MNHSHANPEKNLLALLTPKAAGRLRAKWRRLIHEKGLDVGTALSPGNARDQAISTVSREGTFDSKGPHPPRRPSGTSPPAHPLSVSRRDQQLQRIRHSVEQHRPA
jgi:hypothetical protein